MISNVGFLKRGISNNFNLYDKNEYRKMRKITQEEFDEVVRKHQKYLNGEPDGECANLEYTDLTNIQFVRDNKNEHYIGINLSFANLRFADLSGCILMQCNFYLTNLTGANLSDTILYWANFTDAYCAGVNWHNADFGYEPTFFGAYCTRIYQISLGIEPEFGGNATLTLHAELFNEWEYFIRGFRGSRDELIKYITDDAEVSSDLRRQISSVVECITNIAENNHIRCNRFESEHKHSFEDWLEKFKEKYPDSSN